jgi:hypothetical protein
MPEKWLGRNSFLAVDFSYVAQPQPKSNFTAKDAKGAKENQNLAGECAEKAEYRREVFDLANVDRALSHAISQTFKIAYGARILHLN